MRRALEAAFVAASDAYRTPRLDRADFEREVLIRVTRRLDRSYLAVGPDTVLRALELTSTSDLYLTISCELGLPDAWERVIEVHAARLDGLARQLGIVGDAGSIGRDVLADLSRPPASPPPRTRIGTYDGSGTLFAWLAVVLRRGGATQARRKTPRPQSVEPRALDARPGPDHGDPVAALLDAEDGMTVVRALQAAWRALSTREQLALHFRFGESLTLKEVGSLLQLSESGTSRVVSGALDRLREKVRPLLKKDLLPPDRLRLWMALWQAVGPESHQGDIR
ncbi:MAG: hypothetical protein H6806_10805 [Planctomycetes bacterium]|nr:hypothetical protein [Planctomycetota bacterium]MCB9824189.1 hypothetical protein [Planctomycetota bacterium]MCB9830237.1 hypothetical protein [Planctomycetota bacterium]MCB9902126.1 hypothetical protein [Planctomycetota bacterium]